MKYFKNSEFACRCCGKVLIERLLIDKLDLVREEFGRPIKITSGYRCPLHNETVGGKKNSTHLAGRAADIAPIHADIDELDRLMDVVKKHFASIGDGRNRGFIHVDTRPEQRRWFY